MIIYRDGQAIELTSEELEAAYNEVDDNKYKEAVQQMLDDMGVEISSDDFDEILHRIDNELGENDTYWDTYHCTIEDAINEYLTEMEGK